MVTDTLVRKPAEYRPNVGIALFNAEGKVFVAERMHPPGAWQMPQGGIDDAENPEQAARRELHEETGVMSFVILRELHDWIYYDFPEHLLKNGPYKGQRQKWFALRFTGHESEINLTAHGEPEFQRWRWARLSETVDMIVDFKKPAYTRMIAEFQDLAVPA